MISLDKLPKCIMAVSVVRLNNSFDAPIASIGAVTAHLDEDAMIYREGMSFYVRVNTSQRQVLSNTDGVDHEFFKNNVKKFNPNSWTEAMKIINDREGVVPLYEALLHLNYFIKYNRGSEGEFKLISNNYDRVIWPIKRAAEVHGIKLFLKLPSDISLTHDYDLFSKMLSCPKFYTTQVHHALADAGLQLTLAAGTLNALLTGDQLKKEKQILKMGKMLDRFKDSWNEYKRTDDVDRLLGEMSSAISSIEPPKAKFSFSKYDADLIASITNSGISRPSYFYGNRKEYMPIKVDVSKFPHDQFENEDKRTTAMITEELRLISMRANDYYLNTLESGNTIPYPKMDVKGVYTLKPFDGPDLSKLDSLVAKEIIKIHDVE